MKHLQTIREHIERTNQWLFSVKLKDLLTDENFILPTEENKKKVAELSKNVARRLKRTQKAIENSKIFKDEEDKYSLLDDLDMIINNFEFIVSLATTISDTEWYDFNFDGNFQELFNEYMEELYDFADQRVVTKNGLEKLLWVD